LTLGKIRNACDTEAFHRSQALFHFRALLAVVTLFGAVISNVNNRQNAHLGEEVAVAARAAEHMSG